MKNLIVFCMLISMSNFMYSQGTETPKKDVAFKVVNSKGSPIKEVYVQPVNANSGAYTDKTGVCVFKDLNENDTIMVRLPKYGEANVPVGGLISVEVCDISAKNYSYTSSTGEKVTVGKEKVKPVSVLNVQELLKKQNFNTLDQLLQGRIEGLTISRKADGKVSAVIRGLNTVAEALVVLDGVAIGDINDAIKMVNIRRINTVEVQKQGSEYGMKGMNGVILIKTIQ